LRLRLLLRDAPGGDGSAGGKAEEGTGGLSDREWIRRETAGGPDVQSP